MWTRFLLTLALTLVSTQAFANDGSQLFLQKCIACHTLGGGNRVGPDLLGVTSKRDPAWLDRWIREPDRMLAEEDPTAVELLKQFNQVPMPNLGVTEAESKAIIAYMAEASAAKQGGGPGQGPTAEVPLRMGATPKLALIIFSILVTAVVGVFLMIARSTRDPVPTINTQAAYKVRKVFFLTAALILSGVLVMTLSRTPYPDNQQTPDALIYVAAQQFSFVYSTEPITSTEDLGRVKPIEALELDAGALVEFRVTSLDVTHDFAIYQDDGSVLAQAQAMPGYVNRLRVHFPEAGHFNVLCLEYCGAAHQVMRSEFVVRSAQANKVSTR